MKKLPQTPDLENIASRIVWFEPPAQALQSEARFIAYAMRYGTGSDMKAIRKYVRDEDFICALDRIPPGIVDARSWAYWNVMLGRYPAPPMPVRRLENALPSDAEAS